MIAGAARGRRLRAPSSKGARLTSDKIKGVIFSMLEAEAYRRGFAPEPGDEEREGRFAAAVAWPRVLELYAGSGALAIEALSRGAKWADLVETDSAARRSIGENLRATGLAERACVHAIPTERAVSTLSGPYDLILVDPPYDEPGVTEVLERLVGGGLIGGSAVLVWEHRRTTMPPERLGGRDGATASSEGESASLPGELRRVRTNAHGVAAVSLYAGVPE